MLQTVYLVNKKPVEKQAIENARDATVRFEKVTAFKQISQLINTPPKKVVKGKTAFFIHLRTMSKNVCLPGSSEASQSRFSENEPKSQ